MKKKFISKRHRRIKLKYKMLFVYGILFVLFMFCLGFLSRFKVGVVDLLRYSNNLETHDIKQNVIRCFNVLMGVDVNNPKTILLRSMVYREKVTYNNSSMVFVHDEVVSSDPVVYIYNTHPTEGYADYGNIKTATYYMQEKLESMGVRVLLSTDDIPQILRDNDWTYDDSYLASRMELERVKRDYPSIKIFIDLHRDGLKKEYSTTVIDGKSFAKVLFLVGKEHDNYLSNLEFTTSINDMIASKYPSVTRGVHQMEGPGVHGIYNQDMASNVILLEMGGNENTYDEVVNTIDLIVFAIKEKVDEK